MATAAVRISRRTLGTTVLTSDAALTAVACDRAVRSVTVQMTSTAGGYVQPTGGTQGGAVGSAVVELAASGSAVITPGDCGYGNDQEWQFTVARSSSTNATFKLLGSV